MYQGEVDHLMRQFSDHTCISLSVEWNHHLTTPFPGMNKTLPKSPSNIEIGNDLLSNSNTLSSSSEGDVTTAISYRNDVRTSGELSLIAARLLDTLHKAVLKRVTLISDDHRVCFKSKQQEFHDISHGAAYNQGTSLSSAARVAILFSGGVDSMVLAALTDRQAVTPVFH